MINLRPSDARGTTDLGWLQSRHSFSFGDYFDRRQMAFRSLRVLNEDWIAPASGFGEHPHRDMEIITVVLAGRLQHHDSMGNGSIIEPGDVQRMSAGTGVFHSEMNPDKAQQVHLLQIWLLPERSRLQPSYEQKHFATEEFTDQLRVIASPDQREGSVKIHQNALLMRAQLHQGSSSTHRFEHERHGWLQLIQGEVRCAEQTLRAGDGAAISGETAFSITALSAADLLLFDLA